MTRQRPGLVRAAVGRDQGDEAQLARHRLLRVRRQLLQVGPQLGQFLGLRSVSRRTRSKTTLSSRPAGHAGLIVVLTDGVEQHAQLGLACRCLARPVSASLAEFVADALAEQQFQVDALRRASSSAGRRC